MTTNLPVSRTPNPNPQPSKKNTMQAQTEQKLEATTGNTGAQLVISPANLEQLLEPIRNKLGHRPNVMFSLQLLEEAFRRVIDGDYYAVVDALELVADSVIPGLLAEDPEHWDWVVELGYPGIEDYFDDFVGSMRDRQALEEDEGR